jgi:hypothetical protein
MTSDADPPRFGTLDGKLPSELLEDIAALRSVDASPRELERVGVRLRAQLAADSERARRTARPTKRLFSGTLGLALTFAIGATAGGFVSLGLYLQQRRSEIRETVRPVPTAVPALRTEAPHAVVPSATAESSELGTPAPSAASPASSAGRNVSAATARSVHGGAGSAGAPDPHEEVALLARARSALATDPAEALALTGEHERTFSRGALAQEREVIAIDALLRLGRRAEARARVDRFHRLYPESTHGRRVDVLFEIR